jgi:hypothetical protein
MTHRLFWLQYSVYVMNFVLYLWHIVWSVFFMHCLSCLVLTSLDLCVWWAICCVFFWLIDMYCSWVTHSVLWWFCSISLCCEPYVVFCFNWLICIVHEWHVLCSVDSAWSVCVVSCMLCFVLTAWSVLFMSDMLCVLFILLEPCWLWAACCVLCWLYLIQVCVLGSMLCCVMTVLDADIYRTATSCISAWVLLLDVFVCVCVMCKFLGLLTLCPPVHSFPPVCLEWKFTNNFYHIMTFFWVCVCTLFSFPHRLHNS